MLIVKWVAKSLISIVLMFCASGYLLYLSTGQTPWALLGHNSAGSFFYSLLPVVDIDGAKQVMGQVENSVSQFVPSAGWGDGLSANGSGAKEIYRWVDEAGVTHFSETPPDNTKSEKILLAPLANVMPAPAPSVEPLEQEVMLKSLKERIEQQEAEKTRVLNEI